MGSTPAYRYRLHAAPVLECASFILEQSYKMTKFTLLERKALVRLSAVIVLRLFGLFLVVPIIALYANDLKGSTPLTVGLAVGIYGLTQALLQLPMGFLSDKWGRKPVIYIGLGMFCVGSLVAACSHSIVGLLAGRLLQGSGAISAAVMAYLADLTRPEQRTKAMALLGASIGAAFLLAIVLAHPLAHWFGVPGLFGLATGLGLLGMLLVLGLPAKDVAAQDHSRSVSYRDIFQVLRDKSLLQLDASILCLHMLLAMIFVAVPMLLQHTLHLDRAAQGWLYAPVVLVSFIVAVPGLLLAERRGEGALVFNLAIGLLLLAVLLLAFEGSHYWGVISGLFLFFVAFNTLEALLPSWVSRAAPANIKGAALGIYASSQFLGVFLGGLLAGALLQYYSITAVFASAIVLCVVWWFKVYDLRAPRDTKSNEKGEGLWPEASTK